jgi:hypothetical protein
MLCQLVTVKSRLILDPVDTSLDALLTNAIAAVSARFDLECRRTLARTVNATHEFSADETELLPPCYPIEAVAKFETKTSEADGWVEVQPAPGFLLRRAGVISLSTPLSAFQSFSFLAFPALGRVTYTGGYVLPGEPDPEPSPAGPPPVRLPPDLEQAAVEQVAYWFQNRDRLGVMRQWPKGGTCEQFADLDLLPDVRAVLAAHQRLAL